MSYRVCNGFVSLPSRYDHGSSCYLHNADGGRRSPHWVSKELGSSRHGMESPRPFILSDLEKSIEACGYSESEPLTGQWREYSRNTMSPCHTERARSVSPRRGVHPLEFSCKVPSEYTRNMSSPPVSRRNSLSRLPTWSLEGTSLEQTLSRRGWSGSEIDLRASLSESAQKRADLVQQLRDVHGKLEGQSEELRKRDKELELSRSKLELLSLKQKQLENSISQLEKEKGWLEVSRYEDKKQRGELQDRIINLEMEVMKAKSNLENFNFTNVLTNLSPKTPTNDELNRDLRTARENLLYFRNRVKVLEAEKNEAVDELKKQREGSQMTLSHTNEANQRVTDMLQAQNSLHEELTDLRLSFNNTNLEKELLSSKVMRLEEKVSDLSLRLKVAQSDRERFLQEKLELNRRTQELSLELERAQRGREGFNDQVSDLHIELVGAKAQANRQDQEKVQMKEELIMLKQVNEKLTLELGQTQQKLQSSLDELHQLQAEQKISSNLTAALEAERAQLLGEKQVLMEAVEQDDGSQTNQELRSSQAQLQEERDALRTRCTTLEGALEQAHEQLGSQIQEQQQVTLYWKERWQQAAVSLKNAEEQVEQERAQCQKAADKNTELLQDCEILQADSEELCELRATVSSLKEENSQLKQQMKVKEQRRHLLSIQSHITSTENESPEAMNSKLEELYAELEQAHERIKDLERERSEMQSEIKKIKKESGSVLRIELDACKQQLELERSRGLVLQNRVVELETRNKEETNKQVYSDNIDTQSSTSQSQRSQSNEVSSKMENLQQQLEKERDAKKQMEDLIFTLKEELEDLKNEKPGQIKASLEEVDSELVLVREELHKVWDMLKMKDTELEEQYQELESARSQYTECSSEKVRLEQLVASLQEQMAESDQTLRHLKQMSEMEKTEMDIERSSLELKLAEIQMQKENFSPTAQPGPSKFSPKGSQTPVHKEKCSRCEDFLLQLEKSIQECQGRNVELQEEKNQTLDSLYQLQDILNGLSKQTKINEQVAKNLEVDNETLKKQHRLVTEQLKGLFKEKEKLTKAYAKLPKEERSPEEWAGKSRIVKNVFSSIKAHETRQEELEEERNRLQEDLQKLQGNEQEKDIRNLQRQLVEKSETLSTMASEIKVLREKNESLMKAKLRFQQQVQQIRSISNPRQKRDLSDPVVPRLPVDNEAEFRNPQSVVKARLHTPGSQDSSAPVTGSRTPFQSTSEGSWTSSPQTSRPQTPINTRSTPSPIPQRLNLPASLGKSWRRSNEGSPMSPRSQADSEATSDTQGPLTPRATALLSPRPYRPQQRGQEFKFGESHANTSS
ncbi:uncharacterized protein O3C94_008594 [Discoglossus pictus]